MQCCYNWFVILRNLICIDDCRKTSIVIENVIGSIEIVNGQSVKMQITGSVPTISIDKTDGCIVYLSTECLGANVITAKSSEMNICVPTDDDDWVCLIFQIW